MSAHIKKLYQISEKESRLILGLMSGTSLDGLDIALCKIDGHGKETQLQLLHYITIPYDTFFKEEVKSIMSKKQIDLEKLCILNNWIGRIHGAMINDALKSWNIQNDKIDLIASHGQTIYHAPQISHQNKSFGNATLQIGDGDQIAVKTGITTLSDFRQKHIAAGGEGAPLAAYGDYLLFAHQTINRIILNIGGISNLTFIPAGASFKDIIATDIGPGNKLMDLWVQKKYPDLFYDKDGVFAKEGSVHLEFLKALKNNPFFKVKFPKTTGPELFQLNYIENLLNENNLTNLSFEDVLNNLNQFTADIICEAIDSFISFMPNSEILISGGGIHNKILLEKIENYFKNIKVISTSAMGVNADAKEAILFALLANEHVAGDNKYFGEGGPSMPALKMGKISFAD